MNIVVADADTVQHQLQASSLPAGDHRTRGLAARSVQTEPGEVEKMLLERGVDVSYESIRRWTAKGSVANFGVMVQQIARFVDEVEPVVSFKGAQFPKHVILHAVFFFVRYAVSYRDLEEILAERGVYVDNATLSRWVVKYASALASSAHGRKAPTVPLWRLDETFVKVRSNCCYLYRAVDRTDLTIDFMPSENRDEAAALRFLAKAVSANGLPRACAIDKRGANTAGLKGMNAALQNVGAARRIRVYRSTCLNNVVEQDHRNRKRGVVTLTRPVCEIGSR